MVVHTAMDYTDGTTHGIIGDGEYMVTPGMTGITPTIEITDIIHTITTAKTVILPVTEHQDKLLPIG